MQGACRCVACLIKNPSLSVFAVVKGSSSKQDRINCIQHRPRKNSKPEYRDDHDRHHAGFARSQVVELQTFLFLPWNTRWTIQSE